LDSILNVAAYSVRTQVLGPGNRAVIWVQGCPFHCPGCIAPNWIPFRSANSFSPAEILDKFDLEAIDGFTFSGGEPMEQAEGLAQVIRLARKAKELSLICFTGYRYERLINNPPNSGVPELLQEVDVLIDGPYIQAQNNSRGLRGSKNQRVIHLSSRLNSYDFESQSRRLEVTISDGELSFVGIPTLEISNAITQVIHGSMKGQSDERL
jgi:anaerobic ribonucleoside-triphosphate reductase activating protein